MRRLLIFLLLCSPCFAITHYVRCDVANNGDGTTFASAASPGAVGAFKDLPSSLTRGDTYVMGGSATACAFHLFNDATSTTVPILIRKAETLDNAVAGYNVSFVNTTVKWQDTTNPDPSTASTPIARICTSYYTIDGITSNTDPQTGPSGQGFQFLSANFNKSGGGLIEVGNGCSTPDANIAGVIINHIEYGGAGSMPYFPQQVNCSYAGTTLTLTTTDASNFPFITGDKIDGWQANYSITNMFGTGTALTATVAGGSLTATTATNYCANGLYAVALTGSPFYGLYAHNASVTITNLQILNSYFHDALESARLDNCFGCVMDHNYLANNRITPYQHGSLIQLGETANGTPGTPNSGPITISFNYLLNGVGTSNIVHLGQPTNNAACQPSCGTVGGLYIYGNTFNCNVTGVERCNTSYSTSDNGGLTAVMNSVFANNTVANQVASNGLGTALGQCGTQWVGAASTGNSAYNNVCFNINDNSAFLSAAANTQTVHGNNICIQCAAHRAFTPNATEFFTTTGSSPFAAGTNNFALASDAINIPTGCTNGSSCFRDGLDTGTLSGNPIPGNVVDYYGTTRGSPWDIGALEFVPVVANYTVTLAGSGNANGKVCTDGATCTDGILDAVMTAGVTTGTSTHSFTAGATATLTATATTGSFVSFSGGGCTTSPCTITVNAPLTITATFQSTVACTLTLASNSINAPSTVSATTALTGVSGVGSFWFVLDPLNVSISVCSYPYSGCAAAGQSGNLPYTVSGPYSLGACSNGVCCTGSTAPLNINTGAGSAAH